MKVTDIRPEQEVAKLEVVIKDINVTSLSIRQGTYTHQKKSGEIILVDIQSNDIHYRGKDAKLAVANDITDRLSYIKAIEHQNEKLKEISWMQSHIIRAPLCRIMALIPLINDTAGVNEETGQILKFLSQSAYELDDVIKNITDKSSKTSYDLGGELAPESDDQPVKAVHK